jgi:predicted CXXCH cytochrome family protein
MEKKEISMNKRIFSMGIGFITLLLIIILLTILGNSPSNGETRAGETYLGDGSSNCICHTSILSQWAETDHADSEGDFQNKTGINVYDNSACTPCHVLGWNEISLEGFDPGQAWNSTFNQDRWMVQCENCHGPASEHISGDFQEGINTDRDPYTACGGTDLAGCHNGLFQFGTENVPGWSSSEHAPYDNLNDSIEMNTYCARCKSPSQYDPDSTYSDSEKISWEEYRGITCGDCHDPHNKTEYGFQLRWDPEKICESCHYNIYHETMRSSELEETPSIKREDYPYMEDVSCVECHMWDTPNGTPLDYAVIGHSFEPRIEACVNCHTDIYHNMPNSSAPESEWEEWYNEVDEALIEWGNIVEQGQAEFDTLYSEVDELYKEAEILIELAETNNILTGEQEGIFDQAEYDFRLADHQSRGAHNPSYAIALLTSAKENFTFIIEELNKGVLQGFVRDSIGPLEDVEISINGNSTLTKWGGSYSFFLEPGRYNITAFKENEINFTVINIRINSSTITFWNFSIDNDFDNDGIRDSDDLDDDGDGFADAIDLFPLDPSEWQDTDRDGIGNNEDSDDDGDGHLDFEDDFPLNPNEWRDSDNDGIGDASDEDNNSNNIPDILEIPLVIFILAIPIILFFILNKRIKGKKEEKEKSSD